MAHRSNSGQNEKTRSERIGKEISFLGNYIFSERGDKDEYGNDKFPFREICVTMNLHDEWQKRV